MKLSSLTTVAVVAVALLALPSLASAEECPNAEFRTGPSSYLPDCRAYEMVTPVEKNGAYVEQGTFVSSPEGETVGFGSTSGFAGATSDLDIETGYQDVREASGWSTVAETQSEAQYLNFHGIFSKDFLDESFGNVEYRMPGHEEAVRVWLLQRAGQPESDMSFYLTGLPGSGGKLVKVGPAVPPTASGLKEASESFDQQEEIYVLGMSADGLHLIYEDPEPTGSNQWWFGARGALLEYAGVNKTEPIPVGVDDEGNFVNGCSRQLLGGMARGQTQAQNPISTDGRKIFFTDACQGELFARVDNGEADQHTVSLSEPSKADCAACDTEAAVRTKAKFVGASESGTTVYFSTEQPLLEGEGGLYRYDFDAPEGERLSLVVAGNPTELAISEDGSHVYFLSKSALTHEPSPDAQGLDSGGHSVEAAAVAQLGQQNLYVFERDSRYPAGHIAFVATLSQDPSGAGAGYYDTTPDGRFLVFPSYTDLTVGDLSTAVQLFEYDAQTEDLVRVSAGDNGYNDNGNVFDSYPGSPYREFGEDTYDQPNDATLVDRSGGEFFEPSEYSQQLSVSADGSYVFFSSPDALVPGALDRVVVGIENSSARFVQFAQNIYEYHAGHVSLISDGQDVSTHLSGSQVHLLSTDLSGRDVFFETTDQLLGQDTDSNKDIYDARVDGGFPSPSVSVSCVADSCQGALSPAPVLLAPGSEFQSGGNSPAGPSPQPASTKAKTKPLKSKVKRKKAKRKGKAKGSSVRRTKTRRVASGLGHGAGRGKGGR